MKSAQELRNGFSQWVQQGRTAEELTDGLPPREVGRFFDRWELHGRPDQLPPEGDWLIWLLLGGRGAGKTRAGAEWVRGVALGLHPYAEAPADRIALVGETFADAREVMVEGVSGLLSVHARHERPEWLPARRMLRWSNGARAQVFSAEDPESLRGPQHSHAWSDAALPAPVGDWSGWIISAIFLSESGERITRIIARRRGS
jgi:phage terminase large subunit-like protein